MDQNTSPGQVQGILPNSVMSLKINDLPASAILFRSIKVQWHVPTPSFLLLEVNCRALSVDLPKTYFFFPKNLKRLFNFSLYTTKHSTPFLLCTLLVVLIHCSWTLKAEIGIFTPVRNGRKSPSARLGSSRNGDLNSQYDANTDDNQVIRS